MTSQGSSDREVFRPGVSQSDLALVTQVVGHVDRGRPAIPELALDA